MSPNSHAEHRRPLIVVSASTVDRGPAYFLLPLLEGQAKVRRTVVVAPRGFLTDECSRLGIECFSGAGRMTSELRRAYRALSREGAPVVLANSVGAGVRASIALRGKPSTLLTVVHLGYLSPADAVRFQALRVTARDLRLLCVSPYVQGMVYGSFSSGVETARVLPNSVPDALFDVGRVRLGSGPRNERRLLYVGSGRRRKGFGQLLDTLEHLVDMPDLEVRLVGVKEIYPKSHEERLASLMKRMNIENMGRTNGIEEPLSWATGVFLPSPNESFGRPVVEAAAAGVPVICSDNPGHRCLVQPGTTAYMFPVGRPGLAAEAVREWASDLQEAHRRARLAHATMSAYSASRVNEVLSYYVDEPERPDLVRFRLGPNNYTLGPSRLDRVLDRIR